MSPLKASLMMLVSRFAVVFVPEYWIIMHCSALFVVSIMLITFWIMRFWRIPSIKSNLQKKHDLYIKILREIDERFGFRIKKTIGLEFQRVNKDLNNPNHYYIQLIPIVILELFFIIYGSILWGVDEDFDFAKPERITIEDENQRYSYFAQGIFFPLAWTLVISYTLLLVWYQKFKGKDFKMNWRLLALSIIAFIIILI